MKLGIIQQVGAPLRPSTPTPYNTFVAGFIGSPAMNLMQAGLAGEPLDARVTFGSTELSIASSLFDDRPALADYIGREVVIGLRPEDIQDASLEVEHPGDQRMSPPVSLVEALGSELIVHFGLDVEPHVTMDVEIEGVDAEAERQEAVDGLYSYVARFDPHSKVRQGEPIEMNVHTSRMHFFDPETGLSIWD